MANTSSCVAHAAILLLVLLAVAGNINALMFNLPANGQRCLRDEMHPNQLVVGEYEVTVIPNQQVHYVVSMNERLCHVDQLIFDYFYFPVQTQNRRYATLRATSCLKRKTSPKANLRFPQKLWTRTNCASFHAFRSVSENIASANCCYDSACYNVDSIAEVRGSAHEVSLITKKGVETKNYEGVSPTYPK